MDISLLSYFMDQLGGRDITSTATRRRRTPKKAAKLEWGGGVEGSLGHVFGRRRSASVNADVSRLVPETQRFIEEHEARLRGERGDSGWIGPILEMVREYPGRSLAVAAMAFFFATGSSPAFGLLADFVQSTHDWEPSDYSIMALVAGTFGVVGNSAMGWAADRLGRRPVAMFGFGLFPLCSLTLYAGPEWAIPFVWVPFVFLLTGANVLMRIVSTALFPTRCASVSLTNMKAKK